MEFVRERMKTENTQEKNGMNTAQKAISALVPQAENRDEDNYADKSRAYQEYNDRVREGGGVVGHLREHSNAAECRKQNEKLVE